MLVLLNYKKEGGKREKEKKREGKRRGRKGEGIERSVIQCKLGSVVGFLLVLELADVLHATS